MFYAMCDDILFNLKEKDTGDNFKDFERNVYKIRIACDYLKASEGKKKGGDDNCTEIMAEMMQLRPCAELQVRQG